MKLSSKAKQCLIQIDIILKSEKGELERARSLAEQGYILTIDLHSETSEGPADRVQQAIDMLVEQIDTPMSAIQSTNGEKPWHD